MTPEELARVVRKITRTNSDTFTDQEILDFAKLRVDELSGAILKVDEDILTIPASRDLVADQREYDMPAQAIGGIKRLEADFDGDGEYIKVRPMDLSHYSGGTDEDSITEYFSNNQGEAFYDYSRGSLFLYCGEVDDVTDGLILHYATHLAYITDLTSTTDMSEDPSSTELGIPRILHELLCRGIVIDYKESKEKPIPLNEREQKYEYDLDEAIGALALTNKDEEIVGEAPSGASQWNNGYNL